MAQALMAGDAEAIFGVVIDKAKARDMIAARLVVERLAPILRAGTVKLTLPPVRGVADVAAAMNAVIEAVAAGSISLDDGDRLIGLLDKQRIALETPDLELRLRELEHKYREMAHAQMVDPRRVAQPNGRSV